MPETGQGNLDLEWMGHGRWITGQGAIYGEYKKQGCREVGEAEWLAEIQCPVKTHWYMIQRKYGRCQEGTAIYRDGLSKDQILSIHDIFVTSLHYGLILNLSSLLAKESSSTIYCRIHYGRITSIIV